MRCADCDGIYGQCGCDKPPVDTTPYGDLPHAVQMLAADNARLCEIGLAADKLAEAVKRVVIFGYMNKVAKERIERALQDYEAVRNGQ